MTTPSPRRRAPKKPPVALEIESSHFYVRSDVDTLLEQSGLLEAGRLTHTPFLAFLPAKTEAGPTVTVHVIDRATEVAALPPETLVLVQWQGQWRSDFFRLTAGDVARHLARRTRREALRRADPGYVSVAMELRVAHDVLDRIRGAQPERVAGFERRIAVLTEALAVDPDADARPLLAAAGVDRV